MPVLIGSKFAEMLLKNFSELRSLASNKTSAVTDR
jgi:hypothetical protein